MGYPIPFCSLKAWGYILSPSLQELSLLQAKVAMGPWSGCRKLNCVQNDAMGSQPPFLLSSSLSFPQALIMLGWVSGDGASGKIDVD